MKKTLIALGVVAVFVAVFFDFGRVAGPVESAPVQNGSTLLAVTSVILVASLFTLMFCLSTLRFYVDEEKIRKEDSISSAFRSSIPPERVLTPAGLRRATIAKIAAGMIGISVVLLVIAKVTGPQ